MSREKQSMGKEINSGLLGVFLIPWLAPYLGIYSIITDISIISMENKGSHLWQTTCGSRGPAKAGEFCISSRQSGHYDYFR